MKTLRMTEDFDLFPCPACHRQVQAEVQIDVALHVGGLSSDGQNVEVKAVPEIATFNVNHGCLGMVMDGYDAHE